MTHHAPPYFTLWHDPLQASVTLRHGEILQHAGLPDLGKNVDPTMPYVVNGGVEPSGVELPASVI